MYLVAWVIHLSVVGGGLNGLNMGSVLERYSQVLLPFAFVSFVPKSIYNYGNAVFQKLTEF